MKVINRSDSILVYSLPELNTRRRFSVGEDKDISAEELEALYQSPGGAELLQDFLLVDDQSWVAEHFDAPIEYFWRTAEIQKCLVEDSLDLFSETLEYAPAGVLDLIKRIAWEMPLTDLNKIQAIREYLDFDVQAAVSIMSAQTARPTRPKARKRLRQEEW